MGVGGEKETVLTPLLFFFFFQCSLQNKQPGLADMADCKGFQAAEECYRFFLVWSASDAINDS